MSRAIQQLSRRQLLQLVASSGLAAVVRRPRQRVHRPMSIPSEARRARKPIPWSQLEARLTGRLSRPGAPTYPVDHQLYNPEFDRVRPQAIAFCANADDVARSVLFAREHGLPATPRSGRHSYAGYSTTGGLVIDLSRMSSVKTSGARATVGPGAQLIDIYTKLARRGVAVPAGSCPTVGIGGLALGGGIGVMDRLHGLTCDVLTGLQMVTASGEVVQADARTNPELYWACRGGGGGNFGIVTELRFSTFATADVTLFGMDWPWAAASQVLPAWLEWASAAPDEMWSNCFLQARPGEAEPSVRVEGVWSGALASARGALARLASTVGRPSSQALGQNTFVDAMYIEAGCRGLAEAACHIRGQYPGGTLGRLVTVAKSDILDRSLTGPGVQAFLAGIEERQHQRAAGMAVLDSWGGAINRVPADATAFVHRKALASAQYVVFLPPGVPKSQLQQAQRWMGGWYAALRPYVSGEAYQNYIDPALANWAQAYYGANLAKLQKVKAKWDPDDFFHFAQSIPLPGRQG
ncbi:MAG: FAD-binding oxidoreductase [Acidimicrobiales bacterium]